MSLLVILNNIVTVQVSIRSKYAFYLIEVDTSVGVLPEGSLLGLGISHFVDLGYATRLTKIR